MFSCGLMQNIILFLDSRVQRNGGWNVSSFLGIYATLSIISFHFGNRCHSADKGLCPASAAHVSTLLVPPKSVFLKSDNVFDKQSFTSPQNCSLSNRLQNMLYDWLIFVSNGLILKYTLRQNMKRKKPIHYYWTYFLMDKVLRAQKWKKRRVLSWHALSTLVVVTGGDVNSV